MARSQTIACETSTKKNCTSIAMFSRDCFGEAMTHRVSLLRYDNRRKEISVSNEAYIVPKSLNLVKFKKVQEIDLEVIIISMNYYLFYIRLI